MKKTFLVFVAALAFAAPAPALAAGDPLAAVKADLSKLSADVQAARDAATQSLQKMAIDAQKGDLAAVVADVKTLRDGGDARRAAIKSDLKQLRIDLKAARTAKVDPAGLESLLQGLGLSNKGSQADVKSALQAVLDVVSALKLAVHPAGG
jgi:hypothetical protein